MEAEPPENYDVIAVDAFSGDAIPVHLLTAEALKLYQRHLAPGGIIAFHISNTYLKLGPVVQEQADHAGLHAVLVSTEDDDDTGAFSSDWVLVTANEKFLALPEIANASAKIEPNAGPAAVDRRLQQPAADPEPARCPQERLTSSSPWIGVLSLSETILISKHLTSGTQKGPQQTNRIEEIKT